MSLKRHMWMGLAAVAIAWMGVSSAQAGTLTKAPDLGTYWHPLANNGTYVYADSFVMPAGPENTVDKIGIWLAGSDAVIRFEIYSDLGPGLGPDHSSILTSSASFSVSNSGLTLYTVDVPDVALTAGQTYWVAGSAVGLSGSGGYTVGGHTQNSGGIVDNGTFWYSNNPAGSFFDGQGLTPEMAFELTLKEGGAVAVPLPSAAWGGMALLAALAGASWIRRRQHA